MRHMSLLDSELEIRPLCLPLLLFLLLILFLLPTSSPSFPYSPLPLSCSPLLLCHDSARLLSYSLTVLGNSFLLRTPVSHSGNVGIVKSTVPLFLLCVPRCLRHWLQLALTITSFLPAPPLGSKEHQEHYLGIVTLFLMQGGEFD